jgi:hypothetical protein
MSMGGNQSQQQSANQSSVWGEQAPYLQELYSRASGLMGQQMQSNDPAARLAPIMGGAMPAFQGLAAGGVNPFMEGQINQAQQMLGKNFQEAVMPGIRQGFMQGGGYGGDRQGIAEGLAAGELARTMSMADQNLRSTGWQQGQAGQIEALRMAPGLFNLSGAANTQQWAPLAAYGATLGNPTVLGQGSSSGKSKGMSMGL